MRRSCALASLALGTTLILAPPLAAESLRGTVIQATVERGLVIARRLCADCHAIERGQPVSPNMEAPTFQRVAKTPGMTRTALIVFFRTPHRMMPNLVIEGQDADDLIDYILSLGD